MAVENLLLTSDLISYEPSLENLMFDGSTDFNAQISSAFNEMIVDLKNKGLVLSRLNTPLTIQSATLQNQYDGDKSSEDLINRGLFVLKVSADSIITSNSLNLVTSENYTISLANTLRFQLQGTNDDSNETWFDIGDEITIEYQGVYTIILPSYYKYYRVKKNDSYSGIYEAYLGETLYYYMHLYKSISNVYKTMETPSNSFYNEKSLSYLDMYFRLLNSGRFYYDIDDSGDIDSTEAKQNFSTIRLTL